MPLNDSHVPYRQRMDRRRVDETRHQVESQLDRREGARRRAISLDAGIAENRSHYASLIAKAAEHEGIALWIFPLLLAAIWAMDSVLLGGFTRHAVKSQFGP